MTQGSLAAYAASRPLVRVRLAAYILDVLLVTVVGLGVTFVFSRLVQGAEPVGANPLNPGGIPVAADPGLLTRAGPRLHHAHLASTPAHARDAGPRPVISDERDGGPLSYRQGVVRWAVVNLAVVATIVAGLVVTLGYVSALLDYAWYSGLLASTARSATNQGFHDRAAGSIVTDEPIDVWSVGRQGIDLVVDEDHRRWGASGIQGTAMRTGR